METPKDRNLGGFFINPRFQLKFMSYFVTLFIITTVSLYSTTFLFFWNFQKKAMDVGIPAGHVFYKFLGHQKHDLDLLFIGLAVFNLILLLTVGFIISHRIAGPLFKMKKHLEQMNDTEEEFILRDKDFFQDLPPVINKVKKKFYDV